MAEGLSAVEAERKARLFGAAEKRLEGVRGGEALARWFVPGRIEVLGKHTDYAGGRSLLCAVERGFCVVARARPDRVVRIAGAAPDVETRLPLAEEAGAPEEGSWAAYPAAVVRRVARDFPGPLRGADIGLASDLPRSAGLSSGSALVVAIFTALAHVNFLEDHPVYRANIASPEDLAGYLAAVENGLSFGPLPGERGVGTLGGSEDHTAMLCCRVGKLSQFAFRPVRLEREVVLPADWTFAVASSGVIAEKSCGARERYNRLSLAASAVFELWRGAGGPGETLGQAVRQFAAPERIREVLNASADPRFPAGELLGRFEQFLEENEHLVPAAADAFEKKDAAALDAIVTRSELAAERLLRNQVPETIRLVATARAFGAIAASAFGAGFGGSVWALVATEQAESFRAAWRNDYRRSFSNAAPTSEFFITGAGPGRVSL